MRSLDWYVLQNWGSGCTIVSVRLLSFDFGGSKLVRLLYFVNRHDAGSTKIGDNFRK